MADFTATDWAVTITKTSIQSGRRHVWAYLNATVGSTRSATTGLPLPSMGPFGMVQRLDYINVIGGSIGLGTAGKNYLVDYSATDNTLNVFTGTATTDNPITALPSATAVTGILYVEAVGF